MGKQIGMDEVVLELFLNGGIGRPTHSSILRHQQLFLWCSSHTRFGFVIDDFKESFRK